MENPTHRFREMNLVLQLRYESQIKNKNVISWSSQKKKRGHFFVLFTLSEGNFCNICFISMYSVLNTLLENKYFYISKNITSYTFVACF